MIIILFYIFALLPLEVTSTCPQCEFKGPYEHLRAATAPHRSAPGMNGGVKVVYVLMRRCVIGPRDALNAAPSDSGVFFLYTFLRFKSKNVHLYIFQFLTLNIS